MALYRNLIRRIYDIKAHDGNVTSLNLGETGRVIVTGGSDSNVNLWAIGQDKCFMSLTGHNRSIEYVRFDYNDDFVYSTDDIGIIRRWDLNAQRIDFTLNGHMKSVRTLDFNPSREYIASGSDDTTVRLWDIRTATQKCVKTYRAHISAVNSVKFSPDGLWIASAGSEGCIRIWDIRSGKQIKNYVSETPAGAATCIQFHPFEFLLAAGYRDGSVRMFDLESNACISSTLTPKVYEENPITCITFSENGRCMFTGSAAGVSVLGWEPDREFDNIKSNWTNLADMKIVNHKLICGCFEGDAISVNATKIDAIIPFFDPSVMRRSDSTRRTFSERKDRTSDALRLSSLASTGSDNSNGQPAEPISMAEYPPSAMLSTVSSIVNTQHSLQTTQAFSSSSDLTGEYLSTNGLDSLHGSLNSNLMPAGDSYSVFPNARRRACSDDDESHTTSQPFDEMLHVSSTVFDANHTTTTTNGGKSTLYASASTMELNNIDVKRTQSVSNFGAMQRSINSSVQSRATQLRREQNGPKHVAAKEVVFSPPTRSKTLLELSNRRRAPPKEKNGYMYMNADELQLVSAAHAMVLQELTRRHSGLSVLREMLRSQDPVGALKKALSMSEQSVFVDLLGAILEKPASWNLDLCLTVLPEIYKLLQSEHKFYFTRACETLRIILNDFQPIIHENLTSAAMNGLGVDLPREERHRKCVECQRWLLRIRNLRPAMHIANNLSNLQKMIITT